MEASFDEMEDNGKRAPCREAAVAGDAASPTTPMITCNFNL